MFSSHKSYYSIVCAFCTLFCVLSVFAESTESNREEDAKKEQKDEVVSRPSPSSPSYVGGIGSFSQERIQRRQELRQSLTEKKSLHPSPDSPGSALDAPSYTQEPQTGEEKRENKRFSLQGKQIRPKRIVFQGSPGINIESLTRLVASFVDKPMGQEELDALYQEVSAYFFSRNITVVVFAVEWQEQSKELVIMVQSLPELKVRDTFHEGIAACGKGSLSSFTLLWHS